MCEGIDFECLFSVYLYRRQDGRVLCHSERDSLGISQRAPVKFGGHEHLLPSPPSTTSHVPPFSQTWVVQSKSRSHSCPVDPGSHSQVNPPAVFTHVPLLQGLLEHSSMSSVQSGPPQPFSQTQTDEFFSGKFRQLVELGPQGEITQWSISSQCRPVNPAGHLHAGAEQFPPRAVSGRHVPPLWQLIPMHGSRADSHWYPE